MAIVFNLIFGVILKFSATLLLNINNNTAKEDSKENIKGSKFSWGAVSYIVKYNGEFKTKDTTMVVFTATNNIHPHLAFFQSNKI